MNWKEIEHQMYTMCMVADEDQILLIKRPDHKASPDILHQAVK
jgi:8-oxo-dGTP diphosphatase